MIEALIAGERDSRALAEMARGGMKVKRGALVEALTGRLDDHHAELARILVITWHLLADPTARFNDPGSDFYDLHLHKRTARPATWSASSRRLTTR